MKLSNKQALMLFEIAKWSRNFVSACPGGFSPEQVQNLIDEIINQQSDNLVEVD